MEERMLPVENFPCISDLDKGVIFSRGSSWPLKIEPPAPPRVFVFAFLPAGTRAFAGDMRRIELALAAGPTCHGVEVLSRYRRKRFGVKVFFHLFGRNSKRLVLQEMRDFLGYPGRGGLPEFVMATRRFAVLREFIGDRNHKRIRRVLGTRAVNGGIERLLGAWNRMPSKYLRELEQFDRDVERDGG